MKYLYSNFFRIKIIPDTKHIEKRGKIDKLSDDLEINIKDVQDIIGELDDEYESKGMINYFLITGILCILNFVKVSEYNLAMRLSRKCSKRLLMITKTFIYILLYKLLEV